MINWQQIIGNICTNIAKRRATIRLKYGKHKNITKLLLNNNQSI